MVAMQLAHDPTLRSSLRNSFIDRATLSSRPTKKGMKVSELLSQFCHSNVLWQHLQRCQTFRFYRKSHDFDTHSTLVRF